MVKLFVPVLLAVLLSACSNNALKENQSQANSSSSTKESGATLPITGAPVPIIAEKLEEGLPNSVSKSNPQSELHQLTPTTGEKVNLSKASLVKSHDDLWSQLGNDQTFANKASDQRVERYLSRYTNNQAYFDRVMKRALLYMPHIAARLKENQMPPELALLPFVESTYNPFAYSSSNAAGLWQFIPATADHLGLKSNWWYDGRRDVITSTDAALRYLNYLHNRFSGDWLLALAAYNCGEGTLNRAILRNRSRGIPVDYWSLKLPSETRAYVPHFLALAKIVRNPESYGLEFPALSAQSYFDVVALDQQVDLQQAALLANIDTEALYKLNPGFLRWATPPSGPFNILLPAGAGASFKTRFASVPKNSWLPAHHHIVQQGDTLSEIAQRYHVSLDAVVNTNKLKSMLIIDGQILTIPTGIATDRAPLPSFVHGRSTHRVRKGDTLYGIAKMHRVSLSKLAKWNNWPLSKILRPGQIIIIRQQGQQYVANRKSIHYQVKKGDSLSQIAQNFNVAVSDIMVWNAIGKRALLLPGQQLILYPRS